MANIKGDDIQTQVFTPGGATKPVAEVKHGPAPLTTPPPAPAPKPEIAQPPMPQPAATPPVVSKAPEAPIITAQPAAQPSPASSSPDSKFKQLIIAAAAAFLLIGGSAAAYFGYVLPNNPENVFKTALVNSLKQNQIKLEGGVDSQSKDQPEAALFTVDFAAESNSDQKALAGSVTVNYAGVKFTTEYRYLDKTVYFRLVDIENILALVSGFMGTDASVNDSLNQLAQKLNNQWIEVDQTLISGYGGQCLLDEYGLGDEDADFIARHYEQNSFFTIDETADDTVDGQKALKIKLGFNKDKAKAFSDGMKDAPILKRLKEKCGEDSPIARSLSDEAMQGESIPDGPAPEIRVWVDKKTKRFVKAEVLSAVEGVTTTLAANITYPEVNVTKPDDAKPLLTFMSDLMKAYGDFTGEDPSLFPTQDTPQPDEI